MLAYAWPIGLVVGCNILYHISAKSVPSDLNPLASLIVVYLVGAVIAAILFFVLYKDTNLGHELAKMNWAPFVLGIVIVGLEAGFIYAYKVGWPVSAAFITQASVLAIALIIVGYLIFKENITPSKVFGAIICLVGLYFINKPN